MSRPVRAAFLVLSGVLLLIGPFLPWASWNNLLVGKVQGEWSAAPGHEKDPRMVISGFRGTGEFAIHMILTVNGDVTKDLLVESPRPSAALSWVILACGAVACGAAVPRSKPLVSILAVVVASCGLYPLFALLPFLAKASKLSPQIELAPSFEVGTGVMLVSAVLALATAVAVWREPGRAGRHGPMKRAPLDGTSSAQEMAR